MTHQEEVIELNRQIDTLLDQLNKKTNQLDRALNEIEEINELLVAALCCPFHDVTTCGCCEKEAA